MPRSVNVVAARRRRKKIIKQAKGFFGARKNVFTVAKNAVEKGLGYAYRDRRNKKRSFRALWIQRINAGARLHGMSYSEFIGKIHKSGVDLNRKVLADLAMNHPKAFEEVVKAVKDSPQSAVHSPQPVVESSKPTVDDPQPIVESSQPTRD